MEKSAELETETEQGSQEATLQVENREDENGKQQHKGEESRKRKIGADATIVKQRKEIANNFISEKATALMEGSLKDRGFIAERGFKKVISPFVEIL